MVTWVIFCEIYSDARILCSILSHVGEHNYVTNKRISILFNLCNLIRNVCVDHFQLKTLTSKTCASNLILKWKDRLGTRPFLIQKIRFVFFILSKLVLTWANVSLHRWKCSWLKAFENKQDFAQFLKNPPQICRTQIRIFLAPDLSLTPMGRKQFSSHLLIRIIFSPLRH